MANNKETKKEETALVVEIEALLTPAKLKEIATTGEDGQFISLVDIDHTKALLNDLATKYAELKVTKDNWKQEGVEAEKVLRQSRYALQRIHKSNNAFLNEVKRGEKSTYDGLIELIQPQEQRIYDEVNAFKEIAKKQKEEADRKEKERVEGIEKALKEAEFALEKAVIQGKTDEDVITYDKFLEDLKANFETFEELEFSAKRLHAIYTAKREKLINQVEEQKKLNQQRAEQDALEKKRTEQKGKIFELRKKALTDKGLSINGINFIGFGLNISVDEVRDKDEVEWYELQDEVDKTIESSKAEAERVAKEQKEKQDQEEKDELLKAIADWDELVTIYEGLGGDPKIWKLRKNQIPSQDDLAGLVTATKELQEQKKLLKLKTVKKDIQPFKNEIDAFLKGWDSRIKTAKIENVESIAILENFRTRTLDVVKEVFSEV